jgi:DNA-binding NarL/FixJ family response regulator
MVWNINDIQEMKRRFSAGESVASVADSYGITTAAIYATARNYGISIRTCHNTKEAKLAKKQKKLREQEKTVLKHHKTQETARKNRLREQEKKRKTQEAARKVRLREQEKKRKIQEAARKAHLAEIAKARRSGLSLKAVGAMFNVSKEWVRQSILQYNKTAKRPVPFFRSTNEPSSEITERRQKVMELWRAGLSYLEIVEKLKVSQERIKHDLKVLCKQDPSMGPLPNFSTRKCKIDANAKTEILKARKAGQTYKQIAQKYDVTPGRIYNICQEVIAAASKRKSQWRWK